MTKNREIGIYEEHGGQCLVHIVPTIQDASEWLGFKRDTLYKSLHVHWVMKANGYTVEIIEEPLTIKEIYTDLKHYFQHGRTFRDLLIDPHMMAWQFAYENVNIKAPNYDEKFEKLYRQAHDYLKAFKNFNLKHLYKGDFKKWNLKQLNQKSETTQTAF